jgi:hypothetical protein
MKYRLIMMILLLLVIGGLAFTMEALKQQSPTPPAASAPAAPQNDPFKGFKIP